MKSAGLLLFLLLFCSITKQAEAQEYLLDKNIFSIEMRKFIPPNRYAKVFDWDATAANSLRLFGSGKHEIWTGLTLQTVVAKPYDRVTRVSGVAYLINFRYVNNLKKNLAFEFGLTHFSTHITQDIKHPFYFDIPPLPTNFLNDANLVRLGFQITDFLSDDLPSNFLVFYQPFDVLFPEVWEGKRYSRPIFISLETALWRLEPWQFSFLLGSEGGDKSKVFRTEARLELLKRSQPFGRFQVFIQHTKYTGAEIISTPALGFSRDNAAIGFRIVFK